MRPTSGNALHLERAAEGLDPVGEPPQARAARGVGPADAVVGDLNPDPAVAGPDGNGRTGGGGVLGGVGEGLGADEVGDNCDPPGQLAARNVDVDREGEVLGQRGQRVRQPMLGQHPRMQPLGQPAQLLPRPPKLVLGVDDLLPGLLASGRPSAAAQGDRQLPEPSLGPLA